MRRCPPFEPLPDGQAERIALLLDQYVDCPGGPGNLRLPTYQKDAVRLLIEKEIMTADELRREAVRDFSVIIPAAYFDF